MSNFNMQLAKRYAKKYIKSSKKDKSKILDEYCKITKLKRNTAAKKLRKVYATNFKSGSLKKVKTEKRGRKKVYGQLHRELIKKAWILSNQICAERLISEIKTYINELKKNGKLSNFSDKVITECKNIKLGTLKNILKTFPKTNSKKYKSNAYIYRKVEIDANFKRFVKEPGNFEVDYVDHKDSNNYGPYAITGTYVGLFSQWISRSAALGKSIKSVTEIFEKNKEKIHIKIKRLHPDNCKSTLKMLTHKLEYEQNLSDIDLSRSRPYKKNDNAHVEQKNGDKVRKLVGYFRYDTQEQINVLNEIYEVED